MHPMICVLLSALASVGSVSFARADEPAQPPFQSQPQAVSPSVMNPALSVDGLFALAQFSRDNPLVFEGGHEPRRNGFNLQQIELTFGSNIDPYFRGDANLIVMPGGIIEVEEAYATTLDLPAGLQFKGGSFFTAFGRNNPTHPHSWDWANKPLVLGRFFGGDGLRNLGAQLSWLTPLPWYSEWIVSGQNSDGETAVSFKGDDATAPSPGMRSLADLMMLARWNNFVSVTDSLSLNLGGSYLQGTNNQGDQAKTRIYGADLYLRYRDPSSLWFVALQAEALWRDYEVPGAGDTPVDKGAYAQLIYRLPGGWSRWQAGLRYDWMGPRTAPVNPTAGADVDPTLDTGSRERLSPMITFYPSEFSKIRLQYDYDKSADSDLAQHAGVLQLEFLMGSHGAHKF